METKDNSSSQLRSSVLVRIQIIAVLLVLSGCFLAPDAWIFPGRTAATPTAVEPTAQPTAAILPTPDVESLPAVTAGPAADLPAPAYTITATLDYAAHRLNAAEEIRYTNRSGEPINELLLMVDTAIYPDVFQLENLQSTQGPSITGTEWERTWLHVALDRPLAPGESITLTLEYQLVIPARIASTDLRPMVFGWSAQQTNLVDWFPYLPPYAAGQGWLAHVPGYYGEHQVYEASDFDVSLQVVSTSEAVVVAASAPEQLVDGRRHYRMQGARTFALSLSETVLVTAREVDGIAITGYAFPVHAAAGERAVQTAAEALELYSHLYGPYPYDSLAVVEADFLDGMEYDGLFFLSNGFYNLYSGQDGDYLVALAAHETSHQWWFGLVGSDQATQPWLDEALATYSEKIFYENLYPDALNWWWQVRVLYYAPHGPVDDSIYNPRGEAAAYRAYRDAVYLNGAVFLDQLRKLIGEEVFWPFLREYVARNAGQIATTQGFFELLRSMTSADLAPLLEEYFASPP